MDIAQLNILIGARQFHVPGIKTMNNLCLFIVLIGQELVVVGWRVNREGDLGSGDRVTGKITPKKEQTQSRLTREGQNGKTNPSYIF